MALQSDGRTVHLLADIIRQENATLERTLMHHHAPPPPPAPTGPPATSVADLARVPWTFVALVPSEAHYERAKRELGAAGATVLAAKRGRAPAAVGEQIAERAAFDRLIAVDTVLRELEECIAHHAAGPALAPVGALRHIDRVHAAVRGLRAAVDGEPEG